MKIIKSLILILLASLSGCNKTTDLPGFDEAMWQRDKNGCEGIRLQMIYDLEKVKHQLQGLNQDNVVEILGRPDKNELYKRNQKFFIYEIANAKECKTLSDEQEHIFLSIRFNATGLAKEVMIYRE